MSRLSMLVLLLVAANGVVAQSAEFGRGSSVEAINAIAKTRHPLSGSLSLSRSNSARGDGYEGTLGGELLDDRLWFFAAASVFRASISPPPTSPRLMRSTPR